MISTRGHVILAGGRGSRLGGVNKALLEIGGVRIVDRILSVTRPIVDDVLLVVNDRSLDELHLPLYFDPEPHAGVLPALLAGLTASSAELCLVTACDMPFIQPAVIDRLFQQAVGRDVCMPRVDGRPEPMLAVYRRAACVPAIRDSLAHGQMRMIAFLEGLDVVWMEETQLWAIDPELRSFFNVNEPVDLDRARALAEDSN